MRNKEKIPKYSDLTMLSFITWSNLCYFQCGILREPFKNRRMYRKMQILLFALIKVSQLVFQVLRLIQ